MPRPKYEQGEQTAREKLAQAFWDSLAEKPFEKVTVADIVKRAGVNRNTFYYHFDDLNALAHTIVRETAIEPSFIRILLFRLLQGGGAEVYAMIPHMDERIKHACLLAGRNSSAELRGMLRDAVQDAWMEAFHINLEELDLEGRLAIEFALGGFLSVIAYRADSGVDFNLDFIVESGLSRDILRLTEHIPELRDITPARNEPAGA